MFDLILSHSLIGLEFEVMLIVDLALVAVGLKKKDLSVVNKIICTGNKSMPKSQTLPKGGMVHHVDKITL